MKKKQVLDLVNRMPDEFSLEVLIEHLIVLEKIEIGLKQVAEGKVVSSEEAKLKFKKWLK
jgi:hypothetical protein